MLSLALPLPPPPRRLVSCLLFLLCTCCFIGLVRLYAPSCCVLHAPPPLFLSTCAHVDCVIVGWRTPLSSPALRSFDHVFLIYFIDVYVPVLYYYRSLVFALRPVVCSSCCVLPCPPSATHTHSLTSTCLYAVLHLSAAPPFPFLLPSVPMLLIFAPF